MPAGPAPTTYTSLRIEPLFTPQLPEPAQVVASQSLARLCCPLALPAASKPCTSSDNDSRASSSSQHPTILIGSANSAFSPPQPPAVYPLAV